MAVASPGIAGRPAPRTALVPWLQFRSVVVWLPLLIVLGFAVVWPLVSLEIQSFRGGGLDNYRAAFSSPNIGRTIAYTVGLAVADVIFAVVLGTLLAWCSLHLPRRFQAVGSVLPLMPMLVP